MLKNIYLHHLDDNFKNLYQENGNNSLKYAGSEWSIDPFPTYTQNSFTFNNSLYSSGHLVTAKGIDIFEECIPSSFSLIIISNIPEKSKGFYTNRSDYNPECISDSNIKKSKDW